MKYKKAISILVVVVVLVGGYFYFQNSKEVENTGDVMTDGETFSSQREPDYEGILEKQRTSNKMDFGPLTNVYEDEDSGFSLRYPDELDLVVDERGVVSLQRIDSDGIRGFTLYVYNQSDAPEIFSKATSLEYFKKNLKTKPFEDGSYGQIEPFNAEFINVQKGEPVLKQFSHDREYDIDGRDVTDERCDLCGINDRMYVAFKSPDNYHVITSGPTNDFELEDLIIRSIEY